MQLTKHWAASLEDYVIDLAWSPDGALLAAASGAGPVSLFAAADGAKRHELPGHDNGTNCLAWQPAGRQKAAGDTLQASGEKPSLASPPAPDASRLTPDSSATPDASPLFLATGGQDGAVKFWDAAAGQHTATASLGKVWIEHLAWRPMPGKAESLERRAESPTSASVAGSQLLFASAGKNLTALRADASVLHAFKPAPKTISALAWEPHGGAVAVAYFGGVCLWDADDFVAQKEFPYANGLHALVWSPDGKWLVSGNQDPSVHLWIPEKDEELHMSGYETKVKHLAFDHTSRWLATGGGRDACVWDCAGAGPEGREPAMLPHEAPVCAVAFQHAHGLLATASADGVVRLWSVDRKQPLRATVKMPVAATKLAWSPDDRLLAIGTEKGAVFVLKSEA